jgi:hypothetical protein
MMWLLIKRVLLLAMLATLSVGNLQAAIFTVGIGPGCTHATIQNALDAATDNGPGSDQIRLSGDFSNVAVVAVSAMDIQGGWSNCTSTTPPTSGRSFLFGNSAQTVMAVGANGGASISIANINLRNGGALSSDLNGISGGGLQVSGSCYVSTTRVGIYNNAAARGGGIYVASPASLLLDVDTAVYQNTARHGGGLYIEGATVRSFAQVIQINDNIARYNPTNFVGGNGGGIYIKRDVSTNARGAFETILFEENLPYVGGIEFARNRADDRGGAIHLEGPNTEVIGAELNFIQNSAGQSGGAVNIYNGGVFDLQRRFPEAGVFVKNCRGREMCNTFIGNTVDASASSGNGGAVFVFGGNANIRQALFKDNRANGGGAIGTGNIAGLPNPVNRIRLTGDVFVNNQSPGAANAASNVINMSAGGDLDADYITIGPNAATYAIYQTSGTATNVRLRSSILGMTQTPQTFFAGGTFSADCVLNRTTYPASGAFFTITRPVVGPVGFVNEAVGDLQLGANSAAKDACDGSVAQNSDYADLALNLRNRDDPLSANSALGVFDAGAYETMERFFANGAE